MLSDLEAIKAIDRLCRAAPRNLDLEALRHWIAAHCGLNPHAAGPLDPDPALAAECDRLRLQVATVQDKADKLAARLQVADGKLGEARSRAKVAKNEAKKERNKRLRRDNAAQSPDNEAAQVAKDKRNAYMARGGGRSVARVGFRGAGFSGRGLRIVRGIADTSGELACAVCPGRSFAYSAGWIARRPVCCALRVRVRPRSWSPSWSRVRPRSVASWSFSAYVRRAEQIGNA